MASDPGTRRGALAIGAAKAWFLVAGLAQNVLLPVAIGQGGYGAYKRALAFVNVLSNVIVAASIQSVSRAVASAPEHARRKTMRSAIAIQAAIGLVLGLALLAAVPLIVRNQHAPQLAAPLRVLAGVVIAYGIYAPMVGALNGVRAFGAQAALDASYSTIRTALSVGVGFFLFHRLSSDGALGASVGFLAAAIVIVPCAWLFTSRVENGPGDEGTRFQPRDHLAFLTGLLAMQAFQALLLQVDLIVLGRAVTVRALAEGLADVDARALADRTAGLYAQAQSFGLVPYQLLIAAGFVLFPTVAAARARGDDAAVRDGVARGGAATVVIAGALVAAIGGAPLAVLRFAFGRGAADGLPLELAAPILTTLAIAHGFTALATLGTTLVAASGRGRLAAIRSGVVAGTAIAGVLVGASRATSRTELGMAIAVGLAGGLAVAAALVAAIVSRVVGPYLRMLSITRVAAGVAVALAVGARIPVPAARWLSPIAAVVPLAVYLVVVTVLGEPVSTLLRPTASARPA